MEAGIRYVECVCWRIVSKLSRGGAGRGMGCCIWLIWKWLCAGQWHLESKDSVAVGVARALWPDFTSESRPPFGGPFEQRITSPVADARDLQKRRIAQR
jgi:hypothetical protein